VLELNCPKYRRKTIKKILKTATVKWPVTYEGKPIKRTADFSAENSSGQRACIGVFQALKESNCQPRLIYPAKLSFRIKGKIKNFYNKHKLICDH
jgi:hypothetical protein